MGGQSSKEDNLGSDSSARPATTSWDHAQQSYGQDSYGYSYAHPQASTQQSYPLFQDTGVDRRRLDRKYSVITDDFRSLDQVTEALAVSAFLFPFVKVNVER